jgi:uncharacterized membrane protein
MKSKKNASILLIILGLFILSRYVLNIDFSYSKRNIANMIICICALFFITLGFISLKNVIKKEKVS